MRALEAFYAGKDGLSADEPTCQTQLIFKLQAVLIQLWPRRGAGLAMEMHVHPAGDLRRAEEGDPNPGSRPGLFGYRGPFPGSPTAIFPTVRSPERFTSLALKPTPEPTCTAFSARFMAVSFSISTPTGRRLASA